MKNTTLKKVVILIVLFEMLYFYSAMAFEEKKWGKVDPQYLNMEVFPEDTSAAAIKIFDVGIFDMDHSNELLVTLKRHYQIKIIKESAIEDFADMVISYWHKDIIRSIKAQTILPDGNSIKLDKKNIFNEEAKGEYKIKKFSLPSVEKGCIIEVSYELMSAYIHEFDPWYFQDKIPTIESGIFVQLAPGFEYFANIYNDPQNRIQRSTEKFFHPRLSTYMDRFLFYGNHLPAVKNESYISTLKNYKARLDIQIVNYRSPMYSYEFIKDTKTLCNELLDSGLEDFLKPSGETREYANMLTRQLTSRDQQVQAVFEFSRDSLTAESYDSGIYTRKKQNDILKKRTASPSERNLIMLSILKALNIEVIPLLVSTRDHGNTNPDMPFLSQYNLTTVLANLGDSYYMLDANDRFVTYGQIPPNCLVTKGLLVIKDNPAPIEMPIEGLRSFERIESEFNISKNGDYNGNTQMTSIAYASRSRNWQLSNSDDINEFIEERVASDIDDIEILEADSLQKAVPVDTFRTSFKIKMNEIAEVIDNELYLPPILYHGMKNNVFISERRDFPIEFGYISEDLEINTFIIPTGWTLAEQPKDVRIENPYFTYERKFYTISLEPYKIAISRRFGNTLMEVPSKDYTLVRNDFGKIVDADQEQIVLKIN